MSDRDAAVRVLMDALGISRDEAIRQIMAELKPTKARTDSDGLPVVERVDRGRTRRMG